MEDNNRIKAGAVLDIFVALGILAVGVFVLLFGINWADYVDIVLSMQQSTYMPFKWLRYTVWIVYFIGATTIMYSVKRIVDDVLRMFVKTC